MNRMEQLGLGQVVDKNTLTKESFKKVIIEVVENSNRYRKNAEQLLEILDDEPMKSLDKVMWWMEYVLRHKGTAHMRSPYLTIPAYQYFFIDVFILMILLVVFVITCSYCILKYTRRLFSQDIKHKVE
ncbi:UDP-glycosyltransferase family 35 member B1 [Carabus blaptoides fortunei]